MKPGSEGSKKMFVLIGGSKTKEPKDFLAGCPQVSNENSWKVESFSWEKAELSMRWEDMPNNTFDQDLSLKVKKQRIREKCRLDAGVVVSLEWHVKTRFVYCGVCKFRIE